MNERFVSLHSLRMDVTPRRHEEGEMRELA